MLHQLDVFRCRDVGFHFGYTVIHIDGRDDSALFFAEACHIVVHDGFYIISSSRFPFGSADTDQVQVFGRIVVEEFAKVRHCFSDIRN